MRKLAVIEALASKGVSEVSARPDTLTGRPPTGWSGLFVCRRRRCRAASHSKTTANFRRLVCRKRRD